MTDISDADYAAAMARSEELRRKVGAPEPPPIKPVPAPDDAGAIPEGYVVPVSPAKAEADRVAARAKEPPRRLPRTRELATGTVRVTVAHESLAAMLAEYFAGEPSAIVAPDGPVTPLARLVA